MATTTSSFSAFAQQIKVKNLLTVSINSEVPYHLNLVPRYEFLNSKAMSNTVD